MVSVFAFFFNGHSLWILGLKEVDVGNPFLYVDLEQEIYMQCPKGMPDAGKDNCIIWNKCIYDLVQEARQYYKKAAEILKK